MNDKTIKSIEYLNNNEIYIYKEDIPIYLKELDNKQQIAATSIYENFLVIAGPGAGKTHTMVYRIVHMIKIGINPAEICMITFTRKAAKEMKNRINDILPGVQLGFIGTFHALANYLISKTTSPHRKRFRLIDPQDDLEILKLVKEVYGICFTNNIRMSIIQKILSYRYNVICSIEDSIIANGYGVKIPEDLKYEKEKQRWEALLQKYSLLFTLEAPGLSFENAGTPNACMLPYDVGDGVVTIGLGLTKPTTEELYADINASLGTSYAEGNGCVSLVDMMDYFKVRVQEYWGYVDIFGSCETIKNFYDSKNNFKI